MGRPMDYDAYAPTYAWERRAVPWLDRPVAGDAYSSPARQRRSSST